MRQQRLAWTFWGWRWAGGPRQEAEGRAEGPGKVARWLALLLAHIHEMQIAGDGSGAIAALLRGDLARGQNDALDFSKVDLAAAVRAPPLEHTATLPPSCELFLSSF